MDIRLKENQRHVWLEHVDKSEYSINQAHRIQFHKTGYMDHVVREAIETELRHYNMNKDGVFCLSKSCKPFIFSLKLSGHGTRSTLLCNPYAVDNPSSKIIEVTLSEANSTTVCSPVIQGSPYTPPHRYTWAGCCYVST
jgi:hypothetical protein